MSDTGALYDQLVRRDGEVCRLRSQLAATTERLRQAIVFEAIPAHDDHLPVLVQRCGVGWLVSQRQRVGKVVLNCHMRSDGTWTNRELPSYPTADTAFVALARALREGK